MSNLRPSVDVRTELSELEEYLTGLPAYMASTGYSEPYLARAAELRDELVLSETHEHSTRLQAPVQVLRLKRSWADRHVVPLDFLGSLCRHWHVLALSILQSESKDEVQRNTVMALPALAGSYALGVAVRHDGARVAYDSLAGCFRQSATMKALKRQLVVTPHLDRAAYKALVSLVADQGVDVDFSFLALGSERFDATVELSSEKAAAFSTILSETLQNERSVKLVGTLVGASQTRSRIEIREPGGKVTTASVGDTGILRGARIGGKYSVQLREVTTTEIAAARISVTEVVTALTPVLGQADSEVANEPSEQKISSELFPEGNDLDKIQRLLSALSTTLHPSPQTIGVDYYRASARILGFVAIDGSLTRQGRLAIRANHGKFIALVALQFEMSEVGSRWISWAGVASLQELDAGSAEEFVRFAAEGLSESNVKRRAGTLRSWLKQIRAEDIVRK